VKEAEEKEYEIEKYQFLARSYDNPFDLNPTELKRPNTGFVALDY